MSARSGLSRRQFMETTGALTVLFTLGPRLASAGTQASARLPKDLARTPALDSWIRIDGDGQVTVFSGKVELGQGLRTALAQIAADELDVSLDALALVTADTARTPNEGGTVGSLSIQQSGRAIRQAAAEARAVLIDMAAERWQVPAHALSVRNGIIHGPEGRTISYGELIDGRRFARTARGQVRPKTPEARRYAGRSTPRLDIPAKVFAAPSYIHDLRLPGMVHGRIVRPPRYGARLEAVDKTAAEKMPGVLRIVRDGSFLGVIASREEQAIAAADALRQTAKWSGPPLAPPPDDWGAYLRGLPSIDTVIARRSDQTAAPGPARRLAADYIRPFQAHASIGPSAAVALLDNGTYTVWTHSQTIFGLRAALAQLLALPEEKLRLIHMEGAGCYGHNGADDAAADAALLARALPGRPVRLQWMRDDEFAWEPFGSAMAVRLSAGLSANGRITRWRHDVWSGAHTSRPMGKAGNLIAGRHLAAPFARPPVHAIPQPAGGADRNAVPLYAIPDLEVVKHLLPDVPLRVSALRGLGAYANIFAIESFIDELATAAGREPIAFRLAHLEDARARAVIEAVGARAGTPPQGAGVGRGFAFARYKNLAAYLAIALDVLVEPKSGTIRIARAVAAVDAGEAINPDGLRNQIEGGIVQSISWTLKEQVGFDTAGITSRDWAGYPILRFDAVPEIEVIVIDRADVPPVGVGEAAQGPTAAALANAVHAATGARLRTLPATPERLRRALG